MCSFMLIYICMKEFCFIKKVVEIKCKPKQNQRRMENKAGKLASSTVPWLSTVVISGTACAQCWKEGMKNKYRERRGGGDTTLTLAEVATKNCRRPFFVWNDKHRLMWAYQPCKADVLQLCSTAIKHQSRRETPLFFFFIILSFFYIPTKVIVRQIFAHLWRNSPGEHRLKAHQEHAQRWHTQHYWLWLFLQLSAGVAAKNEQLKPEKTKTAKERSQGRGVEMAATGRTVHVCVCVSVRIPVATVNRKQQSMGGDTCMHTGEKNTHISPAAVSCLLSLSLLWLCLMIKQQSPQAVNHAV